MRIVVVGATGNHGTSLCRRLSADPNVDLVLGVARRLPSLSLPKVEWIEADVTRDALDPIVSGADAVMSLVWLIQPGRKEHVTRAVNVDGSARVFHATARAGVPVLVYASSVGAYAAGPKDRAVDESWSTDGIPTSFYSRHKAEVERLLDAFEAEHPAVRVVRMRPGLCFKREAATQIRRLFAGPFLPRSLLRRTLIPFVPSVDRLRFQAVHTDDLAEAYRLALVNDSARGAYNVAAEPVLDGATLGAALRARQLRVPSSLLRAGAAASYRLRLQPTEPGWVDMGLGVPIMDTTRIRSELGWEARWSSVAAFEELIDGMRQGAGLETPPLDPRTSGPLRAREFGTGVGSTSR
ncbi:MAG TPA: NAD-dependent epimerase/dehydratase family protein [Solirubrobacteraceae bacterium]|jgi:nucleoside-diphosphate-sugar epimerase|nr:NAD-dependent epimerase/dehydratase family protein [Solirubrobacteraceae bacterium]